MNSIKNILRISRISIPLSSSLLNPDDYLDIPYISLLNSNNEINNKPNDNIELNNIKNLLTSITNKNYYYNNILKNYNKNFFIFLSNLKFSSIMQSIEADTICIKLLTSLLHQFPPFSSDCPNEVSINFIISL